MIIKNFKLTNALTKRKLFIKKFNNATKIIKVRDN